MAARTETKDKRKATQKKTRLAERLDNKQSKASTDTIIYYRQD